MAVTFNKSDVYPTGKTKEEAGVRVTPLEESRGGYFRPRQFGYQVQMEDGSWSDPAAKNTVSSTGSGPVVILFDPKKDVVGMIEEFRLPAYFHDIETKKERILARPAGRVLSLIMGGAKAGETIEQAAVRESAEESGVQTGRLRKGPEVLANHAISPDRLTYFVGEFDSTKVSQNSRAGNTSEGELITFKMMPVKELIALTNQTEIGKTLDAVGLAGALWFAGNHKAIKREWAPKAAQGKPSSGTKTSPSNQ